MLMIAAIIMGAFAPHTHAASIEVNVSYDSFSNPDSNPGVMNLNDCSLREAIQNANDDAATYNDCAAGSGADIITFNGVSLITFDNDISVTTDIQIEGPVTFDGGGASNMFVVGATSAAILRLDQVTLQNGSETSGGAINQNGGTIICTESTFQDNKAEFNGGAIIGNGTLNLNACIFERNEAGDDGGAISHNGADPTTMDGVVFRQNKAGTDPAGQTDGGIGGAIYTTSPTTIDGSAFDRNETDVKDRTGVGGGAIYNAGAGVAGVVITASAFSGNQVNGDGGLGGAIFNDGSSHLAINYSHFGEPPFSMPGIFSTLVDGNSANGADSIGGAIYTAGDTLILGTSFFGNFSADRGGAVGTASGDDDITIANSTFSGNSAETQGGAIYHNNNDDELVTLINVTIADNSASQGGGIYNAGDGNNASPSNSFDEIWLFNSILANNTAASGANCGGGTVGANGVGNVVYPPSAPCDDSPAIITSPALGAAQPVFSLPAVLTFVLPIGSGSSALGVGDQSICSAFPILNFDQQGIPGVRPSGDPNCDAGAYESGELGATPTPTPTSTSTPSDTPTATYTPTETATASATASATATETTTATSTDTPPANTLTPTPTSTDTASANTATPTPTSTDTPSANTATPTATSTDTPSANTATPTVTSTDTPSANTATPTPTSTDTPSANTATPTPTSTDTPSANTATPTATSTDTPSANTATPTPTSTETPSGSTATPTTTATATDTGTPGPSPTPSPTLYFPPSSGGPTSAPASVFLCDNLADQSDEAMVAYGGIGNVHIGNIYGNVFCRIIVKDSQVITSLAEIGVESVINAGVIQAVDMFGLLPDGTPVVPFINPMTVCLRGVGSAIFLSAENSLRTPLQIPILGNSPRGYSCGMIPVSGTVVLVGSGVSAQPMPETVTDPTVNSTPLNNCQVRTTNPVNFRSSPSTANAANILELLPYQTLLTATERIPGWFGVLHGGVFGWVSADFVETIGDCG